MNHEFDDHAYALETKRRSKLLNLFEELEASERGARRKSAPSDKKYTRVINDCGFIQSIKDNAIEWIRMGGEKIKIQLTEKIASELKVGDQLFMCIGKRQGNWRIIFLKGIASSMGGDKQMMSFKLPKDVEIPEQVH